MIFRYLLGVIPVAVGFCYFIPYHISFIASLAAYVAFGYEIYVGMIKGFAKKRIFTEFTLMCVATLGAFAIGEYADAAALAYFYSLGEAISDSAYSRSRGSISDLLRVAPDKVTLWRDGRAEEKHADDVSIGDVILVRAGEAVALDGVCIGGGGVADTSSVTGETRPLELYEGVECPSGAVLSEGSVYISVTREYQDSVAFRMQRAVEDARAHKARAEKKISRFASVFTPIAFCVAAAVFAIGALVTGEIAVWAKSAIIVLVVSCPCSLVLSVPLTYFAGLGRAASQGIVFRGGEVMDKMAHIGTVVFDKTGTITEAGICFDGITVLCELDEKKVRDIALSALSHSPHVAARAFCGSVSGDVLDTSDVQTISGKGIVCTVDSARAVFGNAALMLDEGIATNGDTPSGTHIYGAYEGRLICRIDFSSKVKSGAKESIKQLRESGVSRIAVISGDNAAAVRESSVNAGIEEFYSGATPDEKLLIFRRIAGEEKQKNKKSVCAFCGDGLNDSAVITEADVGIAMGECGSALTVDSADVVLMDDDLSKLSLAVKISRKTERVANFNITISLALKCAVVVLGAALAAFGIAFPVLLALVADVGAAVLTVLNSLRAAR